MELNALLVITLEATVQHCLAVIISGCGNCSIACSVLNGGVEMLELSNLPFFVRCCNSLRFDLRRRDGRVGDEINNADGLTLEERVLRGVHRHGRFTPLDEAHLDLRQQALPETNQLRHPRLTDAGEQFLAGFEDWYEDGQEDKAEDEEDDDDDDDEADETDNED